MTCTHCCARFTTGSLLSRFGGRGAIVYLPLLPFRLDGDESNCAGPIKADQVD
jgi:hypothetical protein